MSEVVEDVHALITAAIHEDTPALQACMKAMTDQERTDALGGLAIFFAAMWDGFIDNPRAAWAELMLERETT